MIPGNRAGVGRWRKRDSAIPIIVVQPLDSTVRVEPAFGDVRETCENALRLAKRVRKDDRSAAGFTIRSPPGRNIGECLGLRGPPVDRKTERRLGDEYVAAHGLEWSARRIRLGFVIARHDPSLAAIHDSDLC